MAKTIGFNVAIGGDVAGLNKALKSAQKEINTSSNALKALTKLTKIDPSNTTAFVTKQKELGNQLDATKQKLQLLKEQEQATTDAFNNGEISAKEWSEYQLQIKATEEELEKLQKQYDNFSVKGEQLSATFNKWGSDLTETGEKIKNVGSKISDVGSTLTTSLTVPLAAVGASAVAAFNEYDAGADTIIQKTGAAGETLEGLNKAMEEITATIPVGFEEAGAAVGEVNTRFGLAGEECKKLSQQFLEFAELNGTDVSNSIDVVQKAMAAYGVATEDAGAMLDTLNKVGQDTGISVDTLASSMTSNAQSLKEMGLSASDAATLIGELEKTGIDTSTVMTGMKKVLKEAVESGTTGQEAFAKAISSSEEAVSIFGSKAGPMLYSAFQDGTISAEMFTGGLTSLEDNLGNVEQTYNDTLDPIDEFKTTMNAAIPILAEIGNSIIATLIPALNTVKDVLTQVTAWWSSLSESTQENIVKIAMVVAAIGPVVSTVGKVTQGIGGLITNLGSVSSFIGTTLIPAITSISAPVLAVVGVIAGLVAIFTKLYTSNEGFRDTVNECWTQISTKIGGVIEKVSTLISTFITTIQPLFEAGMNALAPIASAAFEAIANVIDGVLTVIEGIVTVFTGILSGDFSTVWEGIKQIFSGALNIIKTLISTVFNAIKSVIGSVMSGIKNTVSNVWNAISSTISNVVNTVRNTITNVFNSIWNTVSNIFNGIKNAIMNPMETAKNAISNIINTIKGFFNFSISWPHIPTPHFSIKPRGWSIGDLLKGSIPSLGISWYAKAMDKPLVLDGATIFGAMNGQLLGGGEAGREVVMSEAQLKKLGGGNTNTFNISIVQREGEDSKALAERVARLIQKDMDKNEGVFA